MHMIQLNRRFYLWIGLGLAVALLAQGTRIAHADGFPFPPVGHVADIEMPGQKAILVYDEEAGHEELILSVQLLGQDPDAAWVVPVPALPEVRTASAGWFVQLSDRTQPEIITTTVPILFPMLGGAAAPEGAMERGVEVLSREQVGVYDVSVLSSDAPDALLEWLNANGYAFPEEGQPILDAYVAEGWFFVATRVRPGQQAELEGDVQPLWFSFDTARPVYPMRLTALVDEAIDVLLYVLADHRMQIKEAGFETEFAGQLALEPAASEGEALSGLLTGRPYYVTKLRHPEFAAWEATEDLYLQQADSDEPYRKVIHRTVHRPICCPGCCAGLAPLGLLAGLILARRR